MNSKEKENKIVLKRLKCLFLAQAVMLFFSVYWIVKYYSITLIYNLDLYQVFSALGNIGKASFAVSLAIIVLILYFIFIKRNKKISAVFLCLLFFQSTFFFILERLYEVFFMYITVLIVAATFLWANLFLLACVSGIGLVICFLFLINVLPCE